MRWRRWLLVVAGYLLAVAFVGLSAVAGWMYWGRVEARGEQAARGVARLGGQGNTPGLRL